MRPGSIEPESLAELQQQAVLAQRSTLVNLRSGSAIGDDAFHAAEEEIDLLELTARIRVRPSEDSLGRGTSDGQPVSERQRNPNVPGES
jgi:hypothetical protein